eukprot:EG_transcript_14457
MLWYLALYPVATASNPPSTQPSAPSGPRVALYFVGAPRTLNSTLCSILDNVVYPLLVEQCELTLFVLTPNTTGVEQYNLLLNVPGVNFVMRVVSDPPPPPPQCVQHLNARMKLDIHAHYNEELLAHLWDMEAVDLERLAYERSKNVEFDWAMFVRPDVTYVSPMVRLRSLSPTHIYVPPWLSWGGINDRFAIVPRNFTRQYFHLYSALCVTGAVKALPVLRGMNPEWIYHWHLNRSGVPVDDVPDFFFVRTRTYYTPYKQMVPCDLSVLRSKQCFIAFKYQCCRVSLQSHTVQLLHGNCTARLGFAVKMCERIRRWRKKYQSPSFPCIQFGALGKGIGYGANPFRNQPNRTQSPPPSPPLPPALPPPRSKP